VNGPAHTVGLITGTGLYELPGLRERRVETVTTVHGGVEVTTGVLDGVRVAHVPRHGRDHAHLSHHVGARANIAALAELGVGALVSTTVCGAVDRTLELGQLVVFDDLHFPSNRLPDGSLCTLFTTVDAPDRGHWVYERPIASEIRARLVEGARSSGAVVRDGGVYGHVDGPRFNTRSEIAQLAAAGVSAVSQTAGPEVVMAGEARLPFALMGFVTDHANGVTDELTPAETVEQLFRSSAAVIVAALRGALPALSRPGLEPAGIILRL
jgi:purine nucleoside phosphorylase